ncbi:uncharacterized protein EV420DRAFT_1304426 [Desarmillaria tabescens]|uniref:Fungal-type protein kinase domain-containing protein n=1 Tax=Armillaria tabescens TaxID=1929756 RepID=A0AA39NB22_ARMTA|nr:uncharacterized protein EV420DRAFT_1304426 [Desarmillaria tabescens]KAK0462336.1 hypothetical protein EV420DRAFT_1304426 [Desarmillaria tabescens]
MSQSAPNIYDDAVVGLSREPNPAFPRAGSSIGNRHLTPLLFTKATQRPLLNKSRYTNQDSPCVAPHDCGRGVVVVLRSARQNHNQRPLEIDVIKQILDAAPELQKHLPRVCFNLNTRHDVYQMEIRDLKIIAADRCYELWKVDSLEEFKTAFLDIFECHHRAFVKGKALHGDITAENAMFYRHRTHGIRGCLNGFNNSSASTGDGPSNGAADVPFRAEAVPFMALDIIDEYKAPMPRFYRHDLESFVYLLVWAGVHFDIRRHVHGITNEFIAGWTAHASSDLMRAHDNKSQFWINDVRAEGIRSQFREEFIPLWNEWIAPLRELFWDAWRADRMHRKKIWRGQVSELDTETLGGILTFETFMKALGKQPCHWDTD